MFFFSLYDETPFHIFCECDVLNIYGCFKNTLVSPKLTPQVAICGILDSVNGNSFSETNKVFINYILLMFKLYVYKSREKKFININNLIADIQNVKWIEKKLVYITLIKQLLLQKNGI